MKFKKTTKTKTNENNNANANSKPQAKPTPQNGLTEIVFILDRSGSMSGYELDTIGGFNSMIEKQKKETGKAIVSTVLFDTTNDVLHDRVDIEKIQKMTERDYTVHGCTALLDAIGGAIQHIGTIHKYARPEDVPEHTIFIITTDGMENASRKFNAREIKQMIERQTNQYGWEFIFLAANIDALETADRYGIRRDRTVSYEQTSEDLERNYCRMSKAISMVRNCESLDNDEWKNPYDFFEGDEK